MFNLRDIECKVLWQLEGKCQGNSYMPRPGDFQSQSSENMMFGMKVVVFQLSKKTEIKGVNVGYLSMFARHVKKYANIYSFHVRSK